LFSQFDAKKLNDGRPLFDKLVYPILFNWNYLLWFCTRYNYPCTSMFRTDAYKQKISPHTISVCDV